MQIKDVRKDAAYHSFMLAPGGELWRQGVRLKDVRDRELSPGGRARLTLFERVEGGRPHPRLRTSMPPSRSPEPPRPMVGSDNHVPKNGEQFREWLQQQIKQNQHFLAARDLDSSAAPSGSEHFRQNSVRAGRIASFCAEVRIQYEKWVRDGIYPHDQADGALRAINETEDELYMRSMKFDDSDTGTYHSYQHDAPFVHYLEGLLEILPQEGSEDFAVLSPEARYAVRRQRRQLRNHLDHLMRYKYAYKGINELDIERSLGGFLVDRKTRYIVSVKAESPSTELNLPRYELLRIAPASGHPHAGARVYRDSNGKMYLQDHTPVTVSGELLISTPVETSDLTFRRAPKDPHLRWGIPFDWDENSTLQPGPIGWINWAGHCDIKAVMEQLGITLADNPSVHEYRSDSDSTTEFNRDLLLEMVASMMELGSVYLKADGSGYIQRGVHHFGGARNDSLPDRLQFQGPGPGKSFRWPLGRRKDSFRVTGIRFEDQSEDMKTVFLRHIPDVSRVRFTRNPRYLKTVEGDYNVIDITGALFIIEGLAEEFDEDTGQLKEEKFKSLVDLREEPDLTLSLNGLFFLGTYMKDYTTRQVYRFYLDRPGNRIVVETHRYHLEGNKWRPRQLPEETLHFPLEAPLTCTLSREMKRDNPEMFNVLLDAAFRKGQNICADTDMEEEVWNGVVLGIDAEKRAENVRERTQRWHIAFDARFGRAALDFMVRRDKTGNPEAYCPVAIADTNESWPDFLWQDFPDVGTKGVEDSVWIVNSTMLERKIIELSHEPSSPGGFYVYDDHIKNTFEIIYAGLGDYPYTIVHDNKRYGFKSKVIWEAACKELKQMREKLHFET